MKRLVLTLLLSIALPGLAQDEERIIRYHSELRILSDASLLVNETIEVRSNQERIRRGIYRDFPTRYRDRFGNRVVIDFEPIEVLRDGQPEPWFTERMGNGIRINTGNDDFLPGPGSYTFSIRYRTRRQLGFFENHDELYWNVTGLGWDFPIEQASALVLLPEAVPSAQLDLQAYTGPSGSTASDADMQSPADGQARFTTTRPLDLHEGLSIVVGFPKGIVDAPTRAERIGWLLRDNQGLILLLVGLSGILVYYFISWRRVGRGPAAGVIITRYEPPAGHSPGGLRYVLKEGHDQHAYMADLVGLAVKGLLTIETEGTASAAQWSLARTDKPLPCDLSNAERTLMTTLFGSDTLIELKPRDSETATLMQASIRAHGAVIRKQYRGDYIVLNSKVLRVGLLSSIAVVISAFVLAAGHGIPALVVGAIVLVLINIVFFRIMSAPTDRGRKLRDEIEGLQRYLEIAEKDDIARLEAPDSKEPRLNAERFERLLPYAMALEVEDAWTSQFVAAVGAAAAAEASRRVSWYSGSGVATGSLSAMGSSLSKGLSSSISSSATPPGGSSGGGGGGFSGGGGGGGGGGGR